MTELFTKQKKAAEEAVARARGELVDYLVKDAPQEFRYQLWYALERAATSSRAPAPVPRRQRALGELQSYLVEEYGRPQLSRPYHSAPPQPAEDLRLFVLENASTGELMDVINGALRAIVVAHYETGGVPEASVRFYDTVRQRLQEHKLAFDVVERHVVEKDSEELHREVVVPALTLLHGRDRFNAAEKQYRDALDEISKENWADAITDANAAVEIVARTLLGHEQGQLPDLLGALRKTGLFGDAQERRLRKVVDGFAELADIRNKEGDAHGNSSDRGTAWLAVHWAGALIVFLVEQADARGL